MPKAIHGSWKPPPNEIYKVNIDVAYHSDARARGWGIVIRDRNGEVLAAGPGSINYFLRPAKTIHVTFKIYTVLF
jgi:hypothetical protein